MPALDKLSQVLLPVIEADLKEAVERHALAGHPLYSRMLNYHMGWVNQDGGSAHGSTGKRIRPLLCLLACQSAASDFQAARPAATAVELIHNFSLLHDDIQDESPLRRNRPTVWAIWGRAQAINAGDVLFTLAHLALSDSEVGASNERLFPILDQACLALTQGQFLDIRFEGEKSVSVEDYLIMIEGKTASLTGATAELGAAAAKVPLAIQAHYHSLGKNLGMAFQMIDDILDIWGAPELTGKAEASDIYKRKMSLPVLYALNLSDEMRNIYELPEPFDTVLVKRVVGILDRAQAREYAEAKAEAFTHETLKALELTESSNEAGEALLELVNQLLKRDY